MDASALAQRIAADRREGERGLFALVNEAGGVAPLVQRSHVAERVGHTHVRALELALRERGAD